MCGVRRQGKGTLGGLPLNRGSHSASALTWNPSTDFPDVRLIGSRSDVYRLIMGVLFLLPTPTPVFNLPLCMPSPKYLLRPSWMDPPRRCWISTGTSRARTRDGPQICEQGAAVRPAATQRRAHTQHGISQPFFVGEALMQCPLWNPSTRKKLVSFLGSRVNPVEEEKKCCRL